MERLLVCRAPGCGGRCLGALALLLLVVASLDCPHFLPVSLRTPGTISRSARLWPLFCERCRRLPSSLPEVTDPPEPFLPHRSPRPSCSRLPFPPSLLPATDSPSAPKALLPARLPDLNKLPFSFVLHRPIEFSTPAQLRTSLDFPPALSVFPVPRAHHPTQPAPPFFACETRPGFISPPTTPRKPDLIAKHPSTIKHGVGRAIDSPSRRRRLRALSERQDQMRLRERPIAVQELCKGYARMLSALGVHEPRRPWCITGTRPAAGSRVSTQRADCLQHIGRPSGASSFKRVTPRLNDD